MTSVRFDVGVTVEPNSRFRRTMEDAHICQPSFNGNANWGFFSVLDGHGGKQAAEYSEHALADLFSQAWNGGALSVPHALDQAFMAVDKGLEHEEIMYPGATCVAAFVHVDDGKASLYTANVGDARAVISRGGKAIRLSYDHKAVDMNERIRIIEAGGFIMRDRVNGSLAITRALGDLPLKPYVTGHPFTTETALRPEDDVLILACDGVWDVIEDQEAIELVRPIADPKEATNALVRRSLDKGSTDNITAMVIRFHWVGPATGAGDSALPQASRTQQGKMNSVDVTTHH